MENSHLAFANMEDALKELRDGVNADNSVSAMVDQMLDLVSSRPE
jgi:hypothetical protein